jgi:quercetin dioxygenase-like cupin family protein
MANTEVEDMDVAALSLLADALAPVAPPSVLRERLVAELAGPQRFAPLAQEISDVFEVPLPAVLAALARVDDDTAWLGAPSPGPQILPVHGRTVISRLNAGTRIPHHGHKAREITYVLDGTLVSDGEEHRRASCMDMAPGTTHALHVSDDEDCMVVFTTHAPA